MPSERTRVIRPWRPEDSPGVIRVIRSVYDEYGFIWDESGYHADLYDIQSHYIDAGHEFCVADAEGEIVGTAALERFDRMGGELGQTIHVRGRLRAAGADSSLERLYVLASARGSGVGSTLMKHVVERGRQHGLAAMEIWSDKRFEDAHRLYGRSGATVIGERICDDPDRSPEWGLVIDLQKPAPSRRG